MNKMFTDRLTIRAPSGAPDEDGVLRLEFEASNESFSARRATVTGGKAIEQLVAKLSGFPRRIPDQVVFEAGTPADVALTFSTLRNTGQCGVFVSIKASPVSSHGLTIENSASFWVMFEPGDLDIFIKRLENIFEPGEARLGK